MVLNWREGKKYPRMVHLEKKFIRAKPYLYSNINYGERMELRKVLEII